MRTQILLLSVVLFAVGCGSENVDYRSLAECATALQAYHDAPCVTGEGHVADSNWGTKYCDNISNDISSKCLPKLVDLIDCIENVDPSVPICKPCTQKMEDLISCTGKLY